MKRGLARSGSNQSVTQATRSPQPAAPLKPVKPLHRLVPHAPARPVKHGPAVAHKVTPHVARPAKPADVEVADGAEAAAKALGQGKVVVFFFTKPGSADDAATAAAVHSLRGMKRVAVLVCIAACLPAALSSASAKPRWVATQLGTLSFPGTYGIDSAAVALPSGISISLLRVASWRS